MTMIKLLYPLLLLPLVSLATDFRPFESDGCSSFPDGTVDQDELWLPCCVAHDYSYWKGGTYQDRVKADRELEACVASVGQQGVARLMLTGVRVGGTPYLPTRFRWGYGWPYLRGYKALTEDEMEQIEEVEGDHRK